MYGWSFCCVCVCVCQGSSRARDGADIIRNCDHVCWLGGVVMGIGRGWEWVR